MSPLLNPLVPAMKLPLERILCTCSPIPPANLEISAHSFRVSYIPSMLSSFIATRKQDDSCGMQVPALNRVGLACVNQRSDSRLYVSNTASRPPESPWIPKSKIEFAMELLLE